MRVRNERPAGVARSRIRMYTLVVAHFQFPFRQKRIMTKSDAILNLNRRTPASANRRPTANPAHVSIAIPTHHPTANPAHHSTANSTTFSTKFLRASEAGGKSERFKELRRKSQDGRRGKKLDSVWFWRGAGGDRRSFLPVGCDAGGTRQACGSFQFDDSHSPRGNFQRDRV